MWCVTLTVISCRLNKQDRDLTSTQEALTATERELKKALGDLQKSEALLSAGQCLSIKKMDLLETKLAKVQKNKDESPKVVETTKIDDKQKQETVYEPIKGAVKKQDPIYESINTQEIKADVHRLDTTTTVNPLVTNADNKNNENKLDTIELKEINV